MMNSFTDTDLFELAFEYRFEAAHRLTLSCADSCATPHGHTWYAKATFRAPAAGLGQDDMVMEFSKLKSGWKRFIQDTADHSFMHHAQDPILESLRQHIPKFRGLPFPGDPTTELIAALFFQKLSVMHTELLTRLAHENPSADLRLTPVPDSVLIQETPTNSVTFRSSQTNNVWLKSINEQHEGWWQTSDPNDRALHAR